MTIEEKQNQIIEEFEVFPDWMDKYQYLVDLGNALTPMPPIDMVDANLIEGCQSRVWLTAKSDGNTITFQGQSDAVIVKGIVSLLIHVLSGCTLKEVIESDLYFINQIGLKEHLSPTRSNGLAAMVKQMKLYALAYQSKSDQ